LSSSSTLNPTPESVSPLSQRKPETRRVRVERKEEAIITAARHIFFEKGFAKTTMAQIAQKSGVANGTVYIYFENKEALALKVIENFYTRLMQSAQLGVDDQDTIRGKLEFLAKNHLSRVVEEWRILELLPIMNRTIDSYSSSDLFELNKSYVTIFDRVIKEGLRVGALQIDLDLWVLRDIFFGAMDYGAKTMMLKSRRRDIDQFAKNLVDTVCRPTSPRAEVNRALAVDPLSKLADRFERAATQIETALKER